MMYHSSGMHEDGKMGFVTDLRLEMYENVIINVVWVIDYLVVNLNLMKCLGQLLTLTCVIYLFNCVKEGILFWNLQSVVSNE